MKNGLRILVIGMAMAGGVPMAVGAEATGVSPAIKSAIEDLSSDSFKAREKGVKDLKAAMGEQMRALVASTDAASRERVKAALEFQTGLTRWALATMKLPNEQRKGAVEFGLKPEVVGVVAEAFAANGNKRVEGVKTLAKLEDEQATSLLVRLIDDGDRKVSVAATEAAGERKPTNELIDALWNHAVGPNLLWANQNYAVSEDGDDDDEDTVDLSRVQVNGVQELDAACTVLLKMNSPRVNERLAAASKSLEQMILKSPNGAAPIVMINANPLKSYFRLVDGYKTKEAYGMLYRVITGPAGQIMNAPGKAGFYITSRTMYIAEFLKLIGEKPEDYKMRIGKVMGPATWSFAAEADESDAIVKIKEWWTKHGQEYGDAAAAPAEGAKK